MDRVRPAPAEAELAAFRSDLQALGDRARNVRSSLDLTTRRGESAWTIMLKYSTGGLVHDAQIELDLLAASVRKHLRKTPVRWGFGQFARSSLVISAAAEYELEMWLGSGLSAEVESLAAPAVPAAGLSPREDLDPDKLNRCLAWIPRVRQQLGHLADAAGSIPQLFRYVDADPDGSLQRDYVARVQQLNDLATKSLDIAAVAAGAPLDYVADPEAGQDGQSIALSLRRIEQFLESAEVGTSGLALARRLPSNWGDALTEEIARRRSSSSVDI
jgi:hypothetical protein